MSLLAVMESRIEVIQQQKQDRVTNCIWCLVQICTIHSSKQKSKSVNDAICIDTHIRLHFCASCAMSGDSAADDWAFPGGD